jgi:cytochrome c-type biogenesis protein CcmH/NrfF
MRSCGLVLGGPLCIGMVIAIAVVSQRAGTALGGAPPSFQELEESLTCQCGCGLTVHSCNHLQCGSAIPLREEIRAQMSTGKDKDAILAYFSKKYGEKILSSPTTSGFNLVAWVTPFVLVGLGGAFVGMTLLRWSARSRRTSGAAPPPTAQPTSAYGKILEKELRDFDA